MVKGQNEAQTHRTDSEIENPKGIAIIGMAGRFPDAENIEQFWENLKNGKESVSNFSDAELEASGIPLEVFNQPNYVRSKAILSQPDCFDASFFDYSPREASLIDPQHRLFLECASNALENAGYDPDRYPGWIGVYGGAGRSTYWQNNLLHNPEVMGEDDTVFIGNSPDFLTTRVSFKLNLKGPSFNVQTACSTSLVAVHQACQALLTYQCDLALAGGVTVTAPQKSGYLYQEGSVVSADGHCRPFDSKADGIVPGNGVGIVVLKRLEEAIEDGDTIHAVIKGTGLNNDGSVKMSYSAPSRDGQAEAILMAQQMAEVAGDDIGYVETHGTGTALGDPIEIAALTKAFLENTEDQGLNPPECAIASLKSNMGHLDAAAGISGLIKTVCILKQGLIPPSLHFQTPNPEIDFANSPFFVNTQLREWKTNGKPRLAGVSSFGIGGTNAHVVLEEAPAAQMLTSSDTQQLLLLSTKTETALDRASSNLGNHLKQNPDIHLPDVAYTLQVGRRVFNYRRMVICGDRTSAIEALEGQDPTRLLTAFCPNPNRPVVFMFPGGGTQYPNMGWGMYQEYPLFRELIDQCASILEELMGYDIRTLLFPAATKISSAGQTLERVSQALPILFSVEYALAKLWLSWGIQPQLMIGHSMGEYTAATLAGVFSLEDALAVVVERSKLMEQVEPGAMLSVSLSETELLPLLGDDLAIAAINSPSLCVVSGSEKAIDRLQQILEEKQVNLRRLHIKVASHSPCIEPILEKFGQFLRQVSLQSPQIPFISNVTGQIITDAEATNPDYWCTHLRETVRFAQGLETILPGGDFVLLEVGPGNNLSTLARQHPQKSDRHDCMASLRHANALDSDEEFLLAAIGKLWLSGVNLDWVEFYQSEQRHRIPLPTYPFERHRYYIDPVALRDASPKNRTNHQQIPQRKSDIADWFYLPSWQRTLPLAPLKPGSLSGTKDCWIVFSPTQSYQDSTQLSLALIARLQSENQEVISVFPGQEFSNLGDSRYTINPENNQDYHTLIKTIQSQDQYPTRMIHCWSVTSEPSVLNGQETFAQIQDYGYYSLIYWVQAWNTYYPDRDLTLTILSNHIQNVQGTEVLFPEKSTLLGPCQVIPQEYPNITCLTIDIDSSQSKVDEASLIGQLLAEIDRQSPETIVAYRQRQRWIKTFENVRLEENGEQIRPWKAGGVYLITGGWGRIGLMLAKYLTQTVHAKVALVGRRTLPDRSLWQTELSDRDPQDPVSQKLRSLLELEAIGADYLALSADITDETQLRSVFTQVKAQWGTINGVFHAAAITSNKALLCSIAQLGVAESTQQFAPKVFGLYALEKLLLEEPPDFCILFSSNASILGGLGFCAYAAANHFLDCFAADRNRQGKITWISTNWDRWLLSEEEREQKKGSSMDRFAMIPQESLAAMERIATQVLAEQVVVTSGYLQERLKIWMQRQLQPKSNPVTPEQNAPSSEPQYKRTLPNPYVAPTHDIELAIADIWQQLLGIPEVGIYDNFFELGGHSLLAIQLMSRVRDKFGIKLPLLKLFASPIIKSLGDLITEKLAENLSDSNLEDLLTGLEKLTDTEVEEKLKSEE